MDTRDALAAAHVDLFEAMRAVDPAAVRMENVGEARCSRGTGIDEPGWSLYLNRASGLGVGPLATELSRRRRVVFLWPGPRPFIVTLEPDARPRALAGWIEARGLRRRLILVRSQRVPDAALAVPGPFRIEDVGSEGADAYAALASHGLPASVAQAVASLAGRDRWTHSLAFEDGQPVAAAALFVDQGVACLCWSATHPAHRRRGAHTALIAHRVRKAGALGCSVAVAEQLEARPSRPGDALRNLTRGGFQITQNVRVYVG